MKIRSSYASSQTGSILIITLFLAVLAGVFLGSYFAIVKQQRNLVARSQAWNAAFTVAEAGVEEALAQLNPGAPLPWINRAGNGWGGPTAGIYGPVTRNVSGGTYSVAVSTNLYPVIYSTGYVSVASLSAQLTRVVCVSTTNVPLFTVGMAARQNINFSGNNATTDSFDSSNPSLSTNSRWDPSKISTNGTIASMGGVVSVGNANINGEVLLGATASDTIKNNGFISGGVENDFNFDFPNVVLPQTSWINAGASFNPQTIDGVYYQYVFTASTNADYLINNLNGNIYVNTNSHIRIQLTGVNNPDQVRVAGPGSNAGSLALYVNGPSFTLTGHDTVDGGIAGNLSVFGTTNCLNVVLSGNASFTGTIYAPQANVSLGGGGAGPYDFVGSIIANNFSINGGFRFHFDEALLRNGPTRGYAANGWQEL